MDSAQLIRIKKDFYLNIKGRVESILGNESRDLQNYRRNYDQELKNVDWEAVDKRILFARLKQAQIILVGDFHAQKQSSRGLLRILRKIKTPYILALECLNIRDQVWIDRYVKGEMSEKEFLTKVSWKKNWGFPWENYRPLFKWAQQNQIKIFGINAGADIVSLKERDHESAEAIKKIHNQYKDFKIFVQYGDLHLASKHLPISIRKIMTKVDLCVIYQSPEILYFKIMEQKKELTTDVVRIDQNRWALNVLAPWIKWQDYLLFLESGYDKKIKLSEVDPTDTVASSVEFLSKSFGLKCDTSSLSVYTSNDNGFFDIIEDLPSILKKKVIENLQEGQSFYIPEIQVGYLSRFSVNHVIRVAAQYIYFKEGKYSKTIIDPKKDFLKLIWFEAIIYFFSKAKNPKRKTDTLQDIRVALQKEQFDDRGKEALMLALNQKLSELQFLSLGKYKKTTEAHFQKYSKKSFIIAAQVVGGIMGEKMFYAYSKKLIKFPMDKIVLFKDLEMSSFSKAYYESLEVVESWPVSFKSKYDRL